MSTQALNLNIWVMGIVYTATLLLSAASQMCWYTWYLLSHTPSFSSVCTSHCILHKCGVMSLNNCVPQTSSLFHIRMVYIHTPLNLPMEGSPASKSRIGIVLQGFSLVWRPHVCPLSFSRFIGVVNPNQDLNLNGDYFLLFGRGPVGGREIKDSF